MSKMNWAMINALKKKRYEKATPEMKIHIKEEQEIAKKIRTLEQFMDFTNGPCIKLHAGEFRDISKLRVLEWGLAAQWGIKICLVKYPGVRFSKLPGCAPILAAELVDKPKNEERLALIKALAEVKGKHPMAAAHLEEILKADKANDGPE